MPGVRAEPAHWELEAQLWLNHHLLVFLFAASSYLDEPLEPALLFIAFDMNLWINKVGGQEGWGGGHQLFLVRKALTSYLDIQKGK